LANTRNRKTRFEMDLILKAIWWRAKLDFYGKRLKIFRLEFQHVFSS